MALRPLIQPDTMILKPEEGFAPSPIQLSGMPGVHVIVGENNSGKSRLLRQLCLPKRVVLERSFTFRPAPLDKSPFRQYLTQAGSEFVGTLTIRWGRDGKALGHEPRSAGAVEATKGFLESLQPRSCLYVGSNRLFDPRGVAGSYQVRTPEPSNTVGWYFSKQRDKAEENRQLATRIGDAFQALTDGLRLEVFSDGAPIEAHILGGVQPQRALAECGEGLRDLFFLIACVLGEPSADLCIDEPGLRLHPAMQRRLLRFLVEHSQERAIWLASHDGVFVGSPWIRSHVRIRRDGDTSRILPLSSAEERREAMVALGWEPGDAILADIILFCEGSSDKIAFDAVIEAGAHQGVMVVELGGAGEIFAKGDQLTRRLGLARQAAPYVRFAALLDSDGRPKEEWTEVERRFSTVDIPICKLSFVDLECCWIEAGLSHAVLEGAARKGEEMQGQPIQVPSRTEIAQSIEAISADAKGSDRLKALLSAYHLQIDKDDAAALAVRKIDREGVVWKRLCAEVEAAVGRARGAQALP